MLLMVTFSRVTTSDSVAFCVQSQKASRNDSAAFRYRGTSPSSYCSVGNQNLL